MKKITLLLALAVTMLSWTESSALASDFSDVPNTSPFISYIEDLKSLGVTDGTAPGRFGPNQLLTRAQFAKFIAVAFQLSDNKKTVPFTDIQNHWSSSYVRAAYQVGIIEGTSATTFSPDKPLKREEAAALIWRIAKKSGLAAMTVPSFVEKPDAWAAEAVGNVLLHGWYSADVVHNANKWSYRPQDTMTRQEMAALLDLAMKAVPGSLAAVVTTPSAT
ncbi:MAG: penicillin-binding protein, partial [Bacilli bacterium]|nr:penicillin-binding protein [Bacilli bacterium]